MSGYTVGEVHPTAQERADHISEWMRLTEEKREREEKPAQVEQVSEKHKGGRGNHNFVGDVRRSILSSDDSMKTEPRTYTTKHGTEATMNTENTMRAAT